MKQILSAFFLLCSTSLLAQKDGEQPYATHRFTEKLSNVRSETSGGNISVRGESGTASRVEMYVSANNSRNNPLSKETIKQKLEQDYELSIAVSGSTLSVVAKPKNRNNRDWDWKQALNISFRIYVPNAVSTDLATSGGNIALSDLNGSQEFRTSGGNLTIDHVTGKINGRTSGGNIKIRDSKEDIDLSTSGGNITAEACSGTLHLGTSGGNLNLSELKGTVRANTSGGSVHGDHISGDLVTHTSGGGINLKEISAGIDASTSGGNIDVSLSDVTKSVKLSNSGGNISLRLPKNKGMDLRLTGDRIQSETLANFKGSQDKERIEGSVNGGGVSVRANANSGTIRLVMQ
jgi:DUF4097 and DUF4098 domain-containing protein YvlB